MGKPRFLQLPGQPRYQPKSLAEIFGHDNSYVPVCDVELATLDVLGEIGVIPPGDIALLTQEVRVAIRDICASDIDLLEKKGWPAHDDKPERKPTKHDIRALVIAIQEIIPEPLRRWVHVPLTSYDPLDTGRILQYGQAYEVIHPKCVEIIRVLSKLVRKYAKTLQIGRTHKQHALPITVGFWFGTILSRIIYNSKQIDEFVKGLVGKISGAVGAGNAVYGLGIAEKCGNNPFQNRVLDKLGLKPAPISTQILPPEPLAYFLHSCIMLSAALGQFGRDCRNLMATEVAEIGEPFEEGQVGSSTMAQKRNPINFENIEGMWFRNMAEYLKVHLALISEHQRDLVGSPLARDFPIMLVNLVIQLETLLRKNDAGETFLARLTVNEANCRRNFKMSANVVLGEPVYIALQMAGYQKDAHALVNHRAVAISQQRKILLIDAIRNIAKTDSDVAKALGNIPEEVIQLLEHPERYTGNAADQAMAIVAMAEDYLP